VTFRTPHFGPLAGVLCRVLDDGTLEPAPPPGSGAFAVALPTGEAATGNGWQEGEIDGPDTRGNRAALEHSIVASHGEQYREWARSKAERAVTNWDRGVRSGRIQRPKG
jgi:hypothetical protein